MKVIALARVLNEERNLERFLSRYGRFCDEIILSDSGSVDDSELIARSWGGSGISSAEVTWEKYPPSERIYMGKGLFYTRQPQHVSHLFDLAAEAGADWAIYTDVDMVPSWQLLEKVRSYMEKPEINQINVLQYHCYGFHRYFPEMTTGWAPWAFRLAKNRPEFDFSDPRHLNMSGKLDENDPAVYKPEHPEICLHYFAQDEEEIQRKMDFYARMHRPTAHPKERCGPLARIPEEVI